MTVPARYLKHSLIFGTDQRQCIALQSIHIKQGSELGGFRATPGRVPSGVLRSTAAREGRTRLGLERPRHQPGTGRAEDIAGGDTGQASGQDTC